jgi:hypothetical protein
MDVVQLAGDGRQVGRKPAGPGESFVDDEIIATILGP